MSYRKEREIMRLRHDLRLAMATGSLEQARDILATLRRLASEGETASRELAIECERWNVRLALLAS